MKKFVILLITLFTISCSKEEGFGGLATIQGKVFAKNFNSSGTLIAQGYRGDVAVYISKHDDPNYFDKVDSSYDGSYRFQFLQKGTYDIWAFGDCDSCTWDQIFVKKTITISSKKATETVEDLVITF